MNEKRKPWLARNWKWLIPSGCLGGLLLMAGFAFVLVTFVFGIIKNSEVYQVALATSQKHPAVHAALGTPIEPGYTVSGNINVTPTSGDADISFPISGPDGKAKVYAVASKSAGKWTFSVLEVEPENAAEAGRIKLLK